MMQAPTMRATLRALYDCGVIRYRRGQDACFALSEQGLAQRKMRRLDGAWVSDWSLTDLGRATARETFK